MFYTDLHIHSSYAYACARDITLEKLSYWALKKGLSVVGTGDFTHPAWRQELKDKLVPAESGLYRLRPELEEIVGDQLETMMGEPTRFMLQVEISTIYKKNNKTRKVHHLCYVPDFETMDRFVTTLAKIGNLESDGRPILKLDSRDLLEITLNSGDGAYLVPAHIWTPWFAVLGSKGGFNSLEEAYGDLTSEIFALETGLSSDPEMNWRLSQLDRYRLVSSSDAHSPQKLGREATAFSCDLNYFAIKQALETGKGYYGTLEFFPEEGKYHMDGHRSCQARLSPEETIKNKGKCPICQKDVTVGVLHRVVELADRSAQQALQQKPSTAGNVTSLMPLKEVIAEVVGRGPNTKTTHLKYMSLLKQFGPEFEILQSADLGAIEKDHGEWMAEALRRLRTGQVICQGGYDGEYGLIRIFDRLEKATQSAA